MIVMITVEIMMTVEVVMMVVTVNMLSVMIVMMTPRNGYVVTDDADAYDHDDR